MTATYALRQPNISPSHVAAGTPMMFAMVSPSITVARARARFAGGTRADPRTAAAPK